MSCPSLLSPNGVLVKQVIKQSVCCKLVVALEYRWKGFEQANATCDRSCHQHNLLPRALQKTFPQAVVARAQIELNDAARQGNEAAAVTKRNVKGGYVTKFFAERDGTTQHFGQFFLKDLH